MMMVLVMMMVAVVLIMLVIMVVVVMIRLMMMVAVVLIMLVIVVVVVMIRMVMMINGGRDDGDILSIIARGPDRLSNPIESNFMLLIPSRFNSIQFCCNFHLLPKLDTTMKQALNVF